MMKPRSHYKKKLKIWNKNITNGGSCITEAIWLRNTTQTPKSFVRFVIKQLKNNSHEKKVKYHKNTRRTKCEFIWNRAFVNENGILVPVIMNTKNKRHVVRFTISNQCSLPIQHRHLWCEHLRKKDIFSETIKKIISLGKA